MKSKLPAQLSLTLRVSYTAALRRNSRRQHTTPQHLKLCKKLEASTHKSAQTHASTVFSCFMTSTFHPLTPKINRFPGLIMENVCVKIDNPIAVAVFTAQRYAIALYVIIVCPSVRPSQAGTVPKMAKRWIPKITSYDSAGTDASKFQQGHPKGGGGKIDVGRFKAAIFDQCLTISHKRCKITSSPLTTPNHPIFDILYCFSYLRSGWR